MNSRIELQHFTVHLTSGNLGRGHERTALENEMGNHAVSLGGLYVQVYFVNRVLEMRGSIIS